MRAIGKNTIFWCVLLSIFAVRTAPQFWANLRSGHVPTPTETTSLDRLLASTLDVPHATQRLAEVLAPLRDDARLRFVSNKGDGRCDFVYSAVAYLTWPRKIDKVELARNERFSLGEAGVLICRDNEAESAGRRIGPHVVVHSP